MERDGIEPERPPLSVPELMTIVDWFMLLGPTEAAGMGAGPISWQSLRAWRKEMALPINPWVARTIRQMSEDFLSMLEKARSIDCPPPWISETTPHDRDVVAKRVRSLRDGMNVVRVKRSKPKVD